MQISSLIINVATLLIMMLPGILLKKCRLVEDSFGKGLSNLVLYIAQPVLIVYVYISCESEFAKIWPGALAVLLLSIPVHIIFAVVSMLLFKKAPDAHRRMLRLASVFSNAAFMGVPLVQVVLGNEAAIYASIYNITFNFFLWTLGVHLCTHNEGEDLNGDGEYNIKDKHLSAVRHTKQAKALLKVLVHPVTLASIIGIICLATGVNSTFLENIHLGLVYDSLEMIKGLVAPLSMVVIGLRLADIDMTGFFNDVHMYVFLALRHFVLPFIIVGLIFLLKTAGVPIGTDATLVTVIMAAAPAATSATMFAEKYNCDAGYVSRIVVASTIISIATMPLVVMVAQLFA